MALTELLSGIALPIFMYHRVAPDRADHSTASTIVVRIGDFEKQLSWLAERGYKFITLAEAAHIIASDRKTTGKYTVITFDDGTVDNYELAYPLLARMGIPATFFIVAGRAGGSVDWSRASSSENSVPLMSWRQIKELAEAGMEIGSHTLTHTSLPSCTDEVLSREIIESRKVIEDAIGKKVFSFCYPFGEVDGRAARAVREAGYRAACTTKRGNRHRPGDLFELKRVPVPSDITIRQFAFRTTLFYHIEHAIRG